MAIDVDMLIVHATTLAHNERALPLWRAEVRHFEETVDRAAPAAIVRACRDLARLDIETQGGLRLQTGAIRALREMAADDAPSGTAARLLREGGEDLRRLSDLRSRQRALDVAIGSRVAELRDEGDTMKVMRLMDAMPADAPIDRQAIAAKVAAEHEAIADAIVAWRGMGSPGPFLTIVGHTAAAEIDRVLNHMVMRRDLVRRATLHGRTWTRPATRPEEPRPTLLERGREAVRTWRRRRALALMTRLDEEAGLL